MSALKKGRNLCAAIEVLTDLLSPTHAPYSEYFSVIYMIPHTRCSPPGIFLSFISSSSCHTCMCLLCFFCHCNHATARCSQDGIIGENVCTAYFSQGLSLANYCLDGSQRFSPITCIFLVSRVGAGQGSARTVSMVLSLAMASPMSREVAHSGTFSPII